MRVGRGVRAGTRQDSFEFAEIPATGLRLVQIISNRSPLSAVSCPFNHAGWALAETVVDSQPGTDVGNGALKREWEDADNWRKIITCYHLLSRLEGVTIARKPRPALLLHR